MSQLLHSCCPCLWDNSSHQLTFRLKAVACTDIPHIHQRWLWQQLALPLLFHFILSPATGFASRILKEIVFLSSFLIPVLTRRGFTTKGFPFFQCAKVASYWVNSNIFFITHECSISKSDKLRWLGKNGRRISDWQEDKKAFKCWIT